MNRTFTIAKRLYAVLATATMVAALPLLIHAVARLLWVFANIGENLNWIDAVSGYTTGSTTCWRYEDGTRECYKHATYGSGFDPMVTFGKEAPRTFWNYATDFNGLLATHVVAILAIAVLVAVISIVSYIFVGYSVLGAGFYAVTSSIARAHRSSVRPRTYPMYDISVRNTATAAVHKKWATQR